MTTIEKSLGGSDVEIEWEFGYVMERHDSNWGEWVVNGTDKNGNKYTGSCQADCLHPNDLHDQVTEIETL